MVRSKKPLWKIALLFCAASCTPGTVLDDSQPCVTDNECDTLQAAGCCRDGACRFGVECHFASPCGDGVLESVETCDTGGNVGCSNPTPTCTSDCQACVAAPGGVPSAPRFLLAAPGNLRVLLDWDAPVSDGGSPVTNYRIYRDTALLFTTPGISTESLDTHASGMANGATYSYRVSAENRAGESPFSNEAIATPLDPPSDSVTPEQLTGDQIIDTSTTWVNRHIVLTGNLLVTHGGTLALDNTVLEMNLSSDWQYQITVDANGILKVTNNSRISEYHKSQLVGATRYTHIELLSNAAFPSERPNIQIENSTISFMGGTTHDRGTVEAAGVHVKRSGTESWIRNSSFFNMIRGVSIWRNDAFVNITGSYFKDIGMTASIPDQLVGVMYYTNGYRPGEKMVLANTTFQHMFNDKYVIAMAGAAAVMSNGASDLVMENLRFLNSTSGSYLINIYSGERNIWINDIFADTTQNIVMNNNVQNVHAANISGSSSFRVQCLIQESGKVS